MATIEWNHGTYVGEIKDGKPNGKGTWTRLDGQKYVGNFIDGKPHGRGTEYHFSGIILYEGDWKDGKPHGKGTFNSPDGRKYVGEFKDGKRTGKGTELWPDGSKYVGDFKDGRPEGHGTLENANGVTTYVGEWKEGFPDPEGKGKYASPAGFSAEDLLKPVSKKEPVKKVLHKDAPRRDRSINIFAVVACLILAGAAYALTLLSPWLWILSGPLFLIALYFLFGAIKYKMYKCPHCNNMVYLTSIKGVFTCPRCNMKFTI